MQSCCKLKKCAWENDDATCFDCRYHYTVLDKEDEEASRFYYPNDYDFLNFKKSKRNPTN